MKKITILLMTFSLVCNCKVFSQAFFLCPPSVDTIIFNSKKYSNIKVGDYVYEYGNQGFYMDSTHFIFLRKLQITKIISVDDNFKQRADCEGCLSIYGKYDFDSYIEYKVLNKWLISYPEVWHYEPNNYNVLKSFFAISFNKEPIGIELDKGEKIVSNDNVWIDLDDRFLEIGKTTYHISDYGLFTCKFKDGSQQTFYNIECRIAEGIYEMYYVVSEGKKITDFYKYYN